MSSRTSPRRTRPPQASADQGAEGISGYSRGLAQNKKLMMMRKKLIVLALTLPAMSSTALAIDVRCPPKAITTLDGRGLQRHQPFDETHPMYYLPKSLDGGGSLQVLCVGNADVIVGVNTGKPSESFLNFLGGVAHDVLGANAKQAIESASQCYRTALSHKGEKDGTYSGDPIYMPNLQVDCRVDNNFTSFGVFRP
jgi:hypothetical protein